MYCSAPSYIGNLSILGCGYPQRVWGQSPWTPKDDCKVLGVSKLVCRFLTVWGESATLIPTLYKGPMYIQNFKMGNHSL